MYIPSHGCWNQIKEVTEVTNNFSSQFTLVLIFFSFCSQVTVLLLLFFQLLKALNLREVFETTFYQYFCQRYLIFPFKASRTDQG